MVLGKTRFGGFFFACRKTSATVACEIVVGDLFPHHTMQDQSGGNQLAQDIVQDPARLEVLHLI